MDFVPSEQKPGEFLKLMTILVSIDNPAQNIWQEFECEIAHKNRYSPNVDTIMEALEFFSSEATYILEKGEKLYRGRIIGETQLSEDTRQLLDAFPNETILGRIRNSSHMSKLQARSWTQFFAKLCQHPVDANLMQRIEQDGFWGFDARESGAPPDDKAIAGRINPQGISFLYAAKEIDTAIAEVRPYIGQMVSVAEIETTKELKLFDFFVRLSSTSDENSEKIRMFYTTAMRFSKPNHSGEIGYFATQYISEMLKTKFDGIRFVSSLNPDGTNIVLFDTEKDDTGNPKNYVIRKSSIHLINEVRITSEEVLPQKQSENKS